MRPHPGHGSGPALTEPVGTTHGYLEPPPDVDDEPVPFVSLFVVHAGKRLELCFPVPIARLVADGLRNEAIASEQCPDYLEARNL